MFEKLIKEKVRFKTAQGIVTSEDVYDLGLEDLNTLAKSLNKQIKDSEEESFIKTKTTANTTLELKFEFVKHVIDVKLKEADERKTAKEKAVKRAKIMELMNQKENEELSSKSLDDLKKLLEEV